MDKFQAEPDAGGTDRSSGPTPEEISLLMDGELDADRAERACSGLRDAAGVQTWFCYHVIGDCLRGDGASSHGMAKSFWTKLAAEPTVLAPPRRQPAPAAVAWAVAASVAAVGVVGWVALTTMPLPSAITTAQQAASVRAADVRRPAVNEYLLAHQEYSPTTAIQGVRPYLRAVAADRQDASQ